MDGQINIFDYLKNKLKLKACECGNYKLAIRYTGCGIPHSYTPPVYDSYLYTVFCPKCYRVPIASCGFRSNKLTIKEAINDWNTREHKIETIGVTGRYGLVYFAEHMQETIERFPEAEEVLNG